MNKTVTVNIGGIVFHIDENAYEKFKLYLEAIRSHFTTADGRDEIMQDIESRIAEMFQERVKDKQVITLDDVEEVTRLMGKPEEFGDSEEKKEEEKEPVQTGPVKRRMFRNPDDKLLGGVCSGVSAYFDIDPIWIRLIFAISLIYYGSGFWLYIILWIVIPEAKNAAEKLQMKGEPVTVSNIQKNVKEEMDALKKRVDEMSKDGGKKAGTAVGRIFEAIGEIFMMIFKVIGKIMAAFFIFIGVIILLALFVSFFAVLKVPGTHYPAIWNHVFVSGASFFWAYIGVLLVVGVPFVMLAYAGARMLFNIKQSSRVVGWTALGLWMVGLFICTTLGIKIGRQFTEKESVRREISITQPFSKKLFLEADDLKNHEKDYDNDMRGGWDLDDDIQMIVKDGELLSGNVNLDIVKSPTDSFQLTEIFYARGSSRKDAVDNASHISYSFNQIDSLIRFNRYFNLRPDDKFRVQRVQLVLRVPVGASVYFNKNLRRLIFDIDNVQNVGDAHMVGRTWKMTMNGLVCTDCTGDEETISGDKIDLKDNDGSELRIDESGVHIKGSDGSTVAIDSSGVRIKENGKEVVKIHKKGHQVDVKVKEPKQ
ncbi:MAG: PspC domain-containing protein [Bacteroidetes bacterium]|nr:PspC domain-containing protein [Bacteroidota bacterium]